jgi:hypothetical protein
MANLIQTFVCLKSHGEILIKQKKEEFKMEREIIKSRIAKIKAIQSGLQETVSAEDLNYYYKHSKKLSQIRFHLSMKLLLLAA